MNRSHEYAGELLQKAREDARAMVVLMEDAEPADRIVGFHAQQAVEKAIKAVLADRSVEYPLTHNLSVLLDQLEENGDRLLFRKSIAVGTGLSARPPLGSVREALPHTARTLGVTPGAA